MVQELFASFFGVSISTGLVAALLAAFSPLADRRFSPQWRYGAWLVLALRLLIPWSPVFSRTIVVELPELALEGGGNTGGLVPSGSGDTAAYTASQAGSVTLVRLAALVWLAGCVLFLLWHGLGYWLSERQLRRNSRPVEERIGRLLAQVCQETGTAVEKRPVAVLYGSRISSPMLAGLFHPVILLPQASYSDQELSFIFRHELVHFRRRDLYYKLLLMAANAFHWYNPLIYLMVRRANADLELSCDSAVVEGADTARRLAYSETILASVSGAGGRQSYLTTYFWGGKGRERLQARLQNIMEGPGRSGRPLFLLLLLLTALSSGLIACGRTEELSQLTFPAARVETDIPAAAAVYSIEPFQVSIWLPEGWTLRAGEETADPLTCPRTPLDIYDGEEKVGSIGYNTFTIYPDTTEENFYRMVYNELMLSNLVSWDCDYTPVRQTAAACNATCRVRSVLHGEAGRMPDTEPAYSPAVLAYDTELLVYVAASFEEGSLTDDQLAVIAESIRISR